MTEPTPEDDDWDIEAARQRLKPKPGKTAGHDNSKAARKTRKKRLSDSVDHRSLKATGRTEQFNFKSTPGLKERAQGCGKRRRRQVAVWMENAVEEALSKQGMGEERDA